MFCRASRLVIQNFLFFFCCCRFCTLVSKMRKVLGKQSSVCFVSKLFLRFNISNTSALLQATKANVSNFRFVYSFSVFFNNAPIHIIASDCSAILFAFVPLSEIMTRSTKSSRKKLKSNLYGQGRIEEGHGGGERYSFFSCFSYVLVGSAFKFENQGVAVFLFFNNAWLSLCNNTCLNFSNKSWRRNNVNQKGKKCLGKGNHQYIVLVGNQAIWVNLQSEDGC